MKTHNPCQDEFNPMAGDMRGIHQTAAGRGAGGKITGFNTVAGAMLVYGVV